MTVSEAIRKYDCRATDGWSLTYKNIYGMKIVFPTLSELVGMPVKAININLPTKEVEITLNTDLTKF